MQAFESELTPSCCRESPLRELPKPTPIGSRESNVSPDHEVARALDEELALGWYAQALRHHWKAILLVALLGAAGGLAFASLSTVRFEAVATLVVLPPPRTPTAPVNPATFRPILESGSLATKVVADTGLTQTPQEFLETALEIEHPAGTNILKVKVRLADPKAAADASRRIANGAIELTRRLNQEEGSSLQGRLKSHLEEAAQRRATAEKELLSYQQSAQLELLKVDSDAQIEERRDLLRLTIAIETEKARLAAAEKEIARQTPLLSAPRSVGAEEALRRAGAKSNVAPAGAKPEVPATGAKPDVPPKGAKPDILSTGTKSGVPPMAAADYQTLDLTNPYINPVYQTLDFQIATSRTGLAALEQQRRQLVDVRKIGGQELSRLSELYRGRIELARRETNLELANKVYSDLLVRYEESRTEALGFSPQLQLVDDAIVPDRPMPRKRLQSAALGFLTGLLGGGLIALMLEGRKRLVG